MIRDANDDDIPAIAAIYAHAVRYGSASFELDPPDEAEMARRRRALLAALIARCEVAGFRLMVAVIGDSANYASIGLHAAHGFSRAGLLPAIGWKHGRWLDSVLMTRRLGVGSDAPPLAEGSGLKEGQGSALDPPRAERPLDPDT